MRTRTFFSGSLLVLLLAACAEARDDDAGSTQQDEVTDESGGVDAGASFAPIHIHDYVRSDWSTRYVFEVPAGRRTVTVSNMRRYPRPAPPTAYGLELNRDPEPGWEKPGVFGPPSGEWVCQETYTDYRNVQCVVTFDRPGRLGAQIEGWTSSQLGAMDFDLDVR